jgi:hypothetical protein
MSALVLAQRSPLPLNDWRSGFWLFSYLSWTGATSSSIDIYRNGVLIVTIPNDGFYTESPDGRGHAFSQSYCSSKKTTGHYLSLVIVSGELARRKMLRLRNTDTYDGITREKFDAYA